MNLRVLVNRFIEKLKRINLFPVFITYHCNGIAFPVFNMYHCNGMGYVLAINFLLQQLSETSQLLSICFCNALRGACKT